MTVTTYTPYLTATLGGSAINTQLLHKARVEMSFADPVSKGYISCIGDAGGVLDDAATITMGSGASNSTRFNGTVYEVDYLNSGPTVEYVCRGNLLAVQKYRNNAPKGYTLLDLTGGPATDEAIVQAVLNIVGVSYNPGNIGGTGIVRGATAPDGYTWRRGETAMDYLGRLTKASIGYKLVESFSGSGFGEIYRVQILANPTGGASLTFTEGIDIFEGGHTQIEKFDTYAAFEVSGFDYGDGLGPVSFRYPDPLPTVPVYGFSSEMIERDTDADPRMGISCETVTSYLRGELSNPIIKVSGLVTPRDDLIGPGQVHQVNSTLLGGSMTLNCVGVTVEVDDQWFLQTLEYTG